MKSSQHQHQGSIDPLILLILTLGGFLVLPCIVAAVLARWPPLRLTRVQWFWPGLAMLGMVSTGGFLLLLHPWLSVPEQFTTPFRDVALGVEHATWNVSRLWNDIRLFWIESLPLTPLVVCVVHALTPQSVREHLLATKEDDTKALRAASQRTHRLAKRSQIPDHIQQQVVLGLPVGNSVPAWIKKRLVVLSTEELSKHGVVIGSSGSGKSETLLRLAVLAAKVLQWQVIFIDGKGDEDAGKRFLATMTNAGIHRVRLFPDEPYNGWVGTWDALLSRLLAVEEFSDTHYRAIAENVLRLALTAPGTPVTTSTALLSRLNLTNEFLLGLYAGHPEEEAYLGYLMKKDPLGTYNRYAALLSKLNGKLDGRWSYDDVDAAYISLDGLTLSGTVSGLARYFVEDFAHYAGQRKPKARRVLFIFDDLGAVDANLTNMFERVRSRGVSVYVSGQSDQSIAFRGLHQNAERILASATTVILHTCSYPHEILVRAGTQVVIEEASQVTGEQGIGRSSLHVAETLNVHPNDVMQLPVGEAYMIAHGKAQRVLVLPISLGIQVPEENTDPPDTPIGSPISNSSHIHMRLTGPSDDEKAFSEKAKGVLDEPEDEQDADLLR